MDPVPLSTDFFKISPLLFSSLNSKRVSSSEIGGTTAGGGLTDSSGGVLSPSASGGEGGGIDFDF